MGSPFPYHRFKTLFERYGVTLTILKGSHIKMTRQVGEVTYHFVAVVHHNQVLDVYLKKARRRLKLAVEDGVSDEQFFN